jgi:hypothetical protein
MSVTGPSFRRVFERADLDGDGRVRRAELQRYLEDRGLDGLTGRMMAPGAVALFLGHAGADEAGLSWEKFKAAVVPPDLRRPDGAVDAEALRASFGGLSGGKAWAVRADVEAQARARIPSVLGPVRDKLARVTGAMLMEALDADGDGRITPADVDALIADLESP